MKIKKAFAKMGNAIKKAFLKTGSAIKKAFMKTGAAIKKAALKTGRAIKIFGKAFYGLYDKRPLVFCIAASIVFEFYIEAFSRHSFISGLKFMIFSPLVFLYGVILILATLSLSLLLKRGIAMFTSVSVIWISFGTANGVILFNRPSPFAASDFAILPTVLDIITVYLTIPQIIIIVLGLSAAIAGVVLLWIKAPKREVSLKADIIKFASCVALLGAITPTFLATGVLSRDFSDILGAYEKNGFPYSFARSAVCRGISKPDGYSKDKIEEIKTRLDSENTENRADFSSPNIIYVQLESLFDVNRINGVSFSENPIPNFTALRDSCPSGYISVPLCGSGTANTEFEILTGMNIDYFSPGEYPYITLLRDTVSESVAHVLGKNGYKTHAMHNNTAVFYDRHIVYPNLGFDTFTGIEHMYDVEYNVQDWAKDSTLTAQIQKTLTSTAERDFVFTVSVQPHGAYPTEQTGEYGITVSGDRVEDEAFYHMYSYYVNQIKETDKLIYELTKYYESYSEPTVIVFYGDHLPDLKLKQSDLKEGNLYQTEYILWSNFGAFDGVADKNIESYRLSSYVFELIGLNKNIGIMSTAHRLFDGEENYKEILHLLEYDMLYGKNYVLGGNPYSPSQMQLGINEIKLSGVSLDGDTLTVTGEGFNKFSVIYINGKRYDTEYVSGGELRAIGVKIKNGSMVSVSQETADGEVLTSTKSIAYVK